MPCAKPDPVLTPGDCSGPNVTDRYSSEINRAKNTDHKHLIYSRFRGPPVNPSLWSSCSASTCGVRWCLHRTLWCLSTSQHDQCSSSPRLRWSTSDLISLRPQYLIHTSQVILRLCRLWHTGCVVPKRKPSSLVRGSLEPGEHDAE